MSASEPASESHFESDDRRTSQQEQPRELRNGKEQRGGISEAEWTIAIEEKSNVSIFRVPNILVPDTEKREAYVPKRVSLGPYHHRSAELPPMDSHKKRALQRMIARFNNVKNLANDPNNMDFSLEAREEIVREEIVKLQKKIRDSYEEEINWDEKTLALMLSLDGCFILEILRTLSGDILPGASNYYEPLFERNKIRYTGMDILNDILKLENQIPLMVLLKLLKMELNSTDIDVEKKLLKVLRPSFLSFFYPFDYKKDMKQWSWPQPDDQEVHHLLGLLHRFIVCPQSHNGERAGHNYRRLPYQDEDSALNGGDEDSAMSEVACNIHRAVELGNAGIKFKRGDGGIENIKFDQSSATIYLPPITIKDSTEILFRNLIAFEMCKPSEFNYVACYVCLMDQLIDSEADVALLRRKGIVTNRLGSDGEVAKLFNSLCKGVTVSLEDVFDRLTEKVNVHYNNEFKVHCAELVKEHFSSPWKILGKKQCSTCSEGRPESSGQRFVPFPLALSGIFFRFRRLNSQRHLPQALLPSVVSPTKSPLIDVGDVRSILHPLMLLQFGLLRPVKFFQKFLCTYDFKCKGANKTVLPQHFLLSKVFCFMFLLITFTCWTSIWIRYG